jgi:hypothetical protein
VYERRHFKNWSNRALDAQLLKAKCIDISLAVLYVQSLQHHHQNVQLSGLAQLPTAGPHNLLLFFKHLFSCVLVMAQSLQAETHLERLHLKELSSYEQRRNRSQLKVASVLTLIGGVSSY